MLVICRRNLVPYPFMVFLGWFLFHRLIFWTSNFPINGLSITYLSGVVTALLLIFLPNGWRESSETTSTGEEVLWGCYVIVKISVGTKILLLCFLEHWYEIVCFYLGFLSIVQCRETNYLQLSFPKISFLLDFSVKTVVLQVVLMFLVMNVMVIHNLHIYALKSLFCASGCKRNWCSPRS